MPTTVEVVREIDGQEVVTEETLSSQQFGVKLDTTGDGNPDTVFNPAVTTQVEIENSGEVSKTSDQCGNTQRSRTTTEGWLVRVQGIVTDVERGNNLTLSTLRDTVASSDTVPIRSDLLSGTIVVSNVVITQASDLVSIQTEDSFGEEKAFEFQLQLGEEESSN